MRHIYNLQLSLGSPRHVHVVLKLTPVLVQKSGGALHDNPENGCKEDCTM